MRIARPPRSAPASRSYAYDETALLAEIDLMTDWFMPLALGGACSEAERDEHRALWREALQTRASPVIASSCIATIMRRT